MPHRVGTDGIIKKIRETVGDGPVYLSIDVSIEFLLFALPILRCSCSVRSTP